MLAHHVRFLLLHRRLFVALAVGQLLVVLVAGPAAACSGGGPFPIR